MTVLNIDQLADRKLQRERQQEQAVDWGVQALAEFSAAAARLDTPVYGNPDFLKSVYGKSAKNGVWPILRTGDPSNVLIDVGHGASFTRSGSIWTAGREVSASEAATWIAARTGFSTELMERVFNDALLGSSWTVQESLRQAPPEI